MNFLQKIGRKVLLTTQFVLAFLFILFEDIIWENLAEPIYRKIKSLKILQRLKNVVDRIDKYTLLIIFVSLLLSVEGAGVIAGILIVKGKIISGILLYMFKIPIAGFTFWLFKVSKDKLLSFRWFAYSYSRVISGIDWIKSTDIYKSSLDMLIKLKDIIKNIKMRDITSFYSYIKNLKNRNR
jgi:hypothetical protein